MGPDFNPFHHNTNWRHIMTSFRFLVALLLPLTNVAFLPQYQQTRDTYELLIVRSQPIEKSRSTSDPDYDGGKYGNELAKGREHRRSRLHTELSSIGINPEEIESNPEQFGTSALRTYNSFIFPKSEGALAVAESPTRAKVVANNISFLIREHKADRERWLRNVDQQRNNTTNVNTKHSITIILDNVRSAPNVGNILRLSEAAQVESVRLCGESAKSCSYMCT